MRDPGGRIPAATVELEAELRDLGTRLAIPARERGAGLDPAGRARSRIVAAAVPRPWPRRWLIHPAGLPIRRAVALAAIAVLVFAAIAGALGLGLPGIRIVPAPRGSTGASSTAGPVSSASPVPSRSSGSPSAASSPPSPSSAPPIMSGPPGAGMGLGDPLSVSGAAIAVDFPVRLPTATGIGQPAGAWLLDGRLSLVWPAAPALPPTGDPAIGLILSEFRGSLDPGYFEKILGPDTTVTTVRVDEVTGYWISGSPHEIVFVDPHGMPVFDSRRSVGDTLLWSRGEITYRLESNLGQEAAIVIAGSLR